MIIIEANAQQAKGLAQTERRGRTSLPDDLLGIEMVCLQVGGVEAGELGPLGVRAQVGVEEGEAVCVDHRVLLHDGERRVLLARPREAVALSDAVAVVRVVQLARGEGDVPAPPDLEQVPAESV